MFTCLFKDTKAAMKLCTSFLFFSNYVLNTFVHIGKYKYK